MKHLQYSRAVIGTFLPLFSHNLLYNLPIKQAFLSPPLFGVRKLQLKEVK